MYNWIIPKNMWDNFYLDPWVYFRQNAVGGWQLVHILWSRDSYYFVKGK